MSFLLFLAHATFALLTNQRAALSLKSERRRLAAIRLLTATAASQCANITAIFDDAVLLFSNDLRKEEIETVVRKSCADIGERERPHGETKIQSSSNFIPMDLPNFADRHVTRFNDLSNDYDCIERELDIQDSSFDLAEASLILSKCRLVVIRNFFPIELMLEYRTNFSNYLHLLHEGIFDHVNEKTTLGETGLTMPRGANRFEVVLPQYLRNHEVIANEKILEILSHKQVLGENMKASVIGGVVVEAGASVGYWHDDAPFPYEADAFSLYGVAGHDLPPTAVSVFFPLLNMTLEHGPTQFCIGSSHFHGLGPQPSLQNESLVDENSAFAQMAKFMKTYSTSDDDCPHDFMRTPILQMGDVVLFDYSIVHRGMANKSPDLRAMQYLTYSRPWYREPNWLTSIQNTGTATTTLTRLNISFEEFIGSTRFADVSEPDGMHTRGPMENIRNFLQSKTRVVE